MRPGWASRRWPCTGRTGSPAGFPDGQLYLNLRGFGPVGQPVTAAEAIRGFLDAFELPAARTPAAIEAQIGLYRSLLAGKRVLVVLDNAADKELGDRIGEAHTLDSVGYAYHQLGRPAQAGASGREALALASELRAGYAEGVIYGHLGEICLAKGDIEDARTQWQHAVTIFDQLGRADAAQMRAKLAELSQGGSR